MVVSRLAPSPTGSLHIGNVRTFLWAWLSARAQGGRVILRVEDLDTPRVKPGVIEKMLDDLRWLGLDWDNGPGVTTHENFVQSQRREHYQRVHARLLAENAIYPCVCTRAELAAAQSAPHEGDVEPRYSGTCRERFRSGAHAQESSGRAPAWRVKVAPGVVSFDDLLFGKQEIDVHGSVGDFVVAKAPDNPAYQLAVVADDIAMNVTEVVRGDDLIPSTGRQILLYRLLGAPIPRYGHVPLVVGTDGKRLAKRHGDARIATLRATGVDPRHLVATLARWSGLECAARATPAELLSAWSWQKVSRERIVLTAEKLRELG
ncbi:MAG TPA: tRNA glutamyl-Q(34) synthetase GluQRS [Planctomycetota bacterium]|jgi:glutamyl-tRNA synthetase